MSYAIHSLEQAEVQLAALKVLYPNGPPGMSATGRKFSRYSISRYPQGERAPVWGIVVKWRYVPTQERPDLNSYEFGGGFIDFEFGQPKLWNYV